jgi:hypothetical protein
MTEKPYQPVPEWSLFSPGEIQQIIDSPEKVRGASVGANPYRKPNHPVVWHYLVYGEVENIGFLKTGLYTGHNPLDRNKKLYKRVVSAFQVPSSLARLHDAIAVILLNLYAEIEYFYSRYKTTFDGYTESFTGEEQEVEKIFLLAHHRVEEWSSNHHELQATAELNLLRCITWNQAIITQSDQRKREKSVKMLREHLYDSIYYYRSLPHEWIDPLMEVYGMPRPAPPAFYLASVKDRLRSPPSQEDLTSLLDFKMELFQHSKLEKRPKRSECYGEIHRLLKRKQQFRASKSLILDHIETYAVILEAYHCNGRS